MAETRRHCPSGGIFSHPNRVSCRRLSPIVDDRGFLMEVLREDDLEFKRFGQAYLTSVRKGFVKGWHLHRFQWDNIVCVKGEAKVATYDPRIGIKERLRVFYPSEKNQILVTIPPNVYHGFMGLSEEAAVLLNISSEKYNYQDPDEVRVPPHKNKIPYKWEGKDG